LLLLLLLLSVVVVRGVYSVCTVYCSFICLYFFSFLLTIVVNKGVQ